LLFFRHEEGTYALFLVKADGTAERRVADFPQRPAQRRWKPHGNGVVLALYEDEFENARLYDLDLATGATIPVGDRLFRENDFDWLPDGTALVLNERAGNGRNALYVVSYPEGKLERVPADTHDYSGLSLSADGAKLTSVQSTERSDIVVSSDPEKGTFKKTVSGTDVKYRPCWTADGKLVYSSNDGGSYDLYVSDADGSNRKQLTFDRASNETQPAASPDGRYIVFVSDRSGEQGLYRINRDGTGIRSLTPKPTPHYRDYSPQVTPDSQWVLYNHWYYGPSVWRVSIDGGTPVRIKGTLPPELGPGGDWAFGASASPDGRSLAFLYCAQDPKSKEFSGMHIAVASLDGRIVKKFSLFQPGLMSGDDWRVQWSHDGSALYYQSIREPNLWRQPLAGGSPVQVTHFEERLHYFDWSLDGKKLAASRSLTLSDVVLITNFD
jgi:Tol biopolymer transport system component